MFWCIRLFVHLLVFEITPVLISTSIFVWLGPGQGKKWLNFGKGASYHVNTKKIVHQAMSLP